MDAKLRSAISKIQGDKARGNHKKAAKRAVDAIEKFPDSPELYREAVDASLEAGESLQAIQLLKQAFARLPDERAEVVEVARQRAGALGDAALGKFLLEDAIRRRQLGEALDVARDFPDRTVRDLRQRVAMKRNSLTAAARGGHSVSNEIVTNIASELVLSARLDRPDDVAASTTEVLDARPEMAARLVSVLEDVSKAHPTSARIHLALARALCIETRFSDASEHLLAAVELDRGVGPDALELLRTVSDRLGKVPQAIERGLVIVLLVTGQHERAAEMLRSWLQDRAGSAPDVLQIIESHGGPADEVTPVHFVLLDAALESNRTALVQQVLDQLDRTPENRPALLEWLGDEGRDRILPANVMLIHGRMLIAEGEFAEAARILKAVCVSSARDIPGVVALLGPHCDADSALASLHEELAERHGAGAQDEQPAPSDLHAPARETEVPASEGDFDFQTYDEEGFCFSRSEVDGEHDNAFVADAPRPKTLVEGEDQDSEFDVFDGSSILGAGKSDGPRAPVSSSYDGARRPLDDCQAGIVWDEEADEEVEDKPKRRRKGRAVPVVDDSHVRNVAQGLYESGASTFFHVDGESFAQVASAAATDPSPEEIPVPEERIVLEPEPDAEPIAPEEIPVPEEAIVLEPEPDAEPIDEVIALGDESPEPALADMTFDERYALFTDGRLDADSVVELMEEAARDQRFAELERIVESLPDTGDVRQLLSRIEYHIMKDEPNRALDLINRVRGADISEEQRKDLWLKTVACQRMQPDLDAAHRTLTQLVDLYPDCPEVTQLARQNYREYLQNQCAEATVLEKVTSLDGDD